MQPITYLFTSTTSLSYFFPIFLSFFKHLLFKKKIFTLTLTFLPPLPFHLPTTIYFNITLHLSFHLLLFCLFLFTLFYYKFVILFHSLHIFFSVISLSLSLLIFLFYLHLCFRFIILN